MRSSSLKKVIALLGVTAAMSALAQAGDRRPGAPVVINPTPQPIVSHL